MKKTMMRLTVTVLSLLVISFASFAGGLDDHYLSAFNEKPGSTLEKAVLSPAADDVAHCGTPLKHGLSRDWNLLEPATQKVLAKQVAAPALTGEATLPSTNGHFLIHYATTGTDVPTPGPGYTVATWVQKVADTFEAAYSFYIGPGSLGYNPPPTLPAGARYDIYLRSLAGQSIYGQTTAPPNFSAPSPGFPNAYASFIEIDKDFTNDIYTKASRNNGTPLYQPLDSLQITSAHEFHHAIQYGYNIFFDVWYAEATSTWFEAVVYPSILQNYNYVPAWFGNSTKQLDLPVDANATSTGAGYGRWIFNRFLAEKHTVDTVRQFWAALATRNSPDGTNDIPMTPVIDSVLAGGLSTDFLGFAKRVYRQQDWTLAADRNNPHLSYIPVSSFSTYPVNVASIPQPNVSLEHYSFAYYKFNPATFAAPTMTLTVNGTSGITAIAFRKDASTQQINEFVFSNTYPSSVTIPNVAGASEIVLLLVNTTAAATHNANFSTDGTTQAAAPAIPDTPKAAAASSGGGGGGCFIATAAYGSYLHPQVQVLRDFRDTWLLTNAPGRAFVDIYYRLSPPVADFIARRDTLRLLVRLLLTPLVFAVKYPTALAAALLLAVFGKLVAIRRRPKIAVERA